MLIDTERDRSTSKNDSNKDDLAGNACIDQSGLGRRGSGVTGKSETGSSIELLRRGPASRHQKDVGLLGEAGRDPNIIQIVTDRLVRADSTGASYTEASM